MRHALSLLLLISGCEGCRTTAATDPIATPSAEPSALVIPDAAPAACKVGEVTTVDTDIEKEASINVVTLPDGRSAVGYAKADGTPVVAVAGPDGKLTIATVPWKVVKETETKPSGARRYVLRVTPLSADGTSAQAGDDIIDMEGTDKRTYRCGPADAPAMATTSKDSKIVDCRTFTDGVHPFVAATRLSPGNAAWTLVSTPASDPVLHLASLGTAKYDDKQGFQGPVAINVKDAGTVFAARQDGALVLARRDTKLGKLGESVRHSFGTPITTPALATKDRTATIVFGLFGLSELYGASFALDDKPIPKPARIGIDLGKEETVSFSAAYRAQQGDLVVGFISNRREGSTNKVKSSLAKLVILDANLTVKSGVFDLGVTDPREMRLTTLPDGRILAIYIDQGGGSMSVKSVLVTCG